MIRQALPASPAATPRRDPPPFRLDPAAAGLETPAHALLERLARGEHLTLVDVRADNERDLHIPGALQIPLDALSSRWGEVVDDGGLPVCFCATGGQSINAAMSLRERGLSAATSILGGLPAWEDAGGTVLPAQEAPGA